MNCEADVSLTRRRRKKLYTTACERKRPFCTSERVREWVGERERENKEQKENDFGDTCSASNFSSGSRAWSLFYVNAGFKRSIAAYMYCMSVYSLYCLKAMTNIKPSPWLLMHAVERDAHAKMTPEISCRYSRTNKTRAWKPISGAKTEAATDVIFRTRGQFARIVFLSKTHCEN